MRATLARKPSARLVAVLLVAAMSVVAFPGTAANAAPVPSTRAVADATFEVSVTEQTVSKDKVKLPNLVGMRMDKAAKALDKLKLEWDTNKFVIIQKNWWVIKQKTKPGTKVESGTTIELTVSKTKPASSKSSPTPTAAPVPPTDQTSGGLESIFGWHACERVGEDNFPYGFELHYILGQLAQTLDPATDSWYLKAEVSINNEYGATYETVAECNVTGSNEAPVVTNLFIYP